jgi:hypothetical protein
VGSEEQPKKRLTIDQILDEINQIAQDPESGGDRFRALKMLADTKTSEIVLAEPYTEKEVLERTVRLLKGIGHHLARDAFALAFPRQLKRFANDDRYPEVEDWMLEASKKFRTLSALYKEFPEAKHPGNPKGYPQLRSAAVKAAWVQREATRLYVERERLKNIAVKETIIEGPDSTDGNDAARKEEAQVPEA